MFTPFQQLAGSHTYETHAWKPYRAGVGAWEGAEGGERETGAGELWKKMSTNNKFSEIVGPSNICKAYQK